MTYKDCLVRLKTMTFSEIQASQEYKDMYRECNEIYIASQIIENVYDETRTKLLDKYKNIQGSKEEITKDTAIVEGIKSTLKLLQIKYLDYKKIIDHLDRLELDNPYTLKDAIEFKRQ